MPASALRTDCADAICVRTAQALRPRMREAGPKSPASSIASHSVASSTLARMYAGCNASSPTDSHMQLRANRFALRHAFLSRLVRAAEVSSPKGGLTADRACGAPRVPLAAIRERETGYVLSGLRLTRAARAEGRSLRAPFGNCASTPARNTRGRMPAGHRRRTSGQQAPTGHSCRVGSTYWKLSSLP
jgi:hypothetical protein